MGIDKTGDTVLKYIFYAINIICFLAFAIDKFKAASGDYKHRTPEKVLLTLALLGGAPLGVVSMLVFRHKTQKLKFISIMPALALLWVYLYKNYIM